MPRFLGRLACVGVSCLIAFPATSEAPHLVAQFVEPPPKYLTKLVLDLNQDGLPDLVHLVPDTYPHHTRYVAVLEPAAGTIVETLTLAPHELHSIVRYPQTSSLPSHFVTLDLSGVATVWTGLPLRRIGSVELGRDLGLSSTIQMRVGNVDTDSAYELVVCTKEIYKHVRIFDLEQWVEQEFDASGIDCGDSIELIQFDETSPLEILALPGTSSKLPTVHDGSGNLLFTAPQRLSSRLVVGNLDGDQQSEMLTVVSGAGQITTIARIDVGVDWETQLFLDTGRFWSDYELNLIDRDLDQRHEWVAICGSRCTLLNVQPQYYLFDTDYRPFDRECWNVIPNFDVDSRTEALCDVHRRLEMVEYERDDPQWRRQQDYWVPSAFARANVDSSTSEEVVIASVGLDTGVPTRISVHSAHDFHLIEEHFFGGLWDVWSVVLEPLPAPEGERQALAIGTRGSLQLFDRLDEQPRWTAYAPELGMKVQAVVPVLSEHEGTVDLVALWWGASTKCAFTRLHGNDGEVAWTQTVSTASVQGTYRTSMPMTIGRLDEAGEDVLYASCSGATVALDVADGAQRWVIDRQYSDLAVIRSSGSPLLLLASPYFEMEMRDPRSGALVHQLKGRAHAIDVRQGPRDLLVRLNGELFRFDSTTGSRLTDSYNLGRADPERFTVRADRTTGRGLEVLALAPYGVARLQVPAYVPIFASSFEQ